MAKLDREMNVQVGVRYHFECYSPIMIQALIGIDLMVKCPFTGKLEYELKAEPGEIVEVPLKWYETYLNHMPHDIIKDAELKWEESFDNLVVTIGRNALLDTLLNASAPSAGTSWFVGLKDTGTPAAADTMASHASWSELSAIYSEGTRPAFTGATAVSGSADNSASKASFSITSTDDVYGAFLVNESTKGTGAGLLYGAGDFSGARSVQNGDTLNVTVTATITSS